jgi:transcriptional regulator with XRE-family HTH domain
LELGLSIPELAAAASLHPATVHRLIHGQTEARPATLRRLAAALLIPIEELTDQIELDSLTTSYAAGHPIENLLRHQLDLVPPAYLIAATEAALAAMMDVQMGLGSTPPRDLWEPLAMRQASDLTGTDCRSLLVEQFQRIPRLVQRTAARAAISAISSLLRRSGEPPAKVLYRAGGHRVIHPLPTMRDPRRPAPPWPRTERRTIKADDE